MSFGFPNDPFGRPPLVSQNQPQLSNPFAPPQQQTFSQQPTPATTPYNDPFATRHSQPSHQPNNQPNQQTNSHFRSVAPRPRIVPLDPFAAPQPQQPQTKRIPHAQPPFSQFQTPKPHRTQIVPRDPFASTSHTQPTQDAFRPFPHQSKSEPNQPNPSSQPPRHDSRPLNQLFLNYVPLEIFTEEKLINHFSKCNARITNLSFRGGNEPRARRTAVITFANDEDAASALKNCSKLRGRPLNLSYYGSHSSGPDRANNTVPENNELVFTFIPKELFADHTIKNMFNSISDNGVRHVSVKERPFRDGTKRTAIISFVDVDHARKALENLPMYYNQKLNVAYRHKTSHSARDTSLPMEIQSPMEMQDSTLSESNPTADALTLQQFAAVEPHQENVDNFTSLNNNNITPHFHDDNPGTTAPPVPTNTVHEQEHVQEARKKPVDDDKLKQIEDLRRQIKAREALNKRRRETKQKEHAEKKETSNRNMTSGKDTSKNRKDPKQKEPKEKKMTAKKRQNVNIRTTETEYYEAGNSDDQAVSEPKVYRAKRSVYQPDEAEEKAKSGNSWRGVGKKENILDAKTLVGICQSMCPKKEFLERQEQDDVSRFEKTNGKFDERKAVKKYRRSAAIGEEQAPEEVRPSPVLMRVMNHLRAICDTPTEFSEIHHFVRDRTRSLRQDLTIQGMKDATCIKIHEQSVRFHILSEHRLFGEDPAKFVSKQNLEQLDKCLISLRDMYNVRRELRQPTSENEAEIQAYYLITQMSNLKTLSSILNGFPGEVLHSGPVQFALRVIRASSESTGNAASYFRCVREAPYLAACLMHSRFTEIRKRALTVMNQAHGCNASSDSFPIIRLTHMLGFEDHDETLSFCETLGFEIEDVDDPALAAIITPSKSFNTKNISHWVVRKADKLIEKKVENDKLSTIIAENGFKDMTSVSPISSTEAAPRKRLNSPTKATTADNDQKKSVLSRLGQSLSSSSTPKSSTPQLKRDFGLEAEKEVKPSSNAPTFNIKEKVAISPSTTKTLTPIAPSSIKPRTTSLNLTFPAFFVPPVKDKPETSVQKSSPNAFITPLKLPQPAEISQFQNIDQSDKPLSHIEVQDEMSRVANTREVNIPLSQTSFADQLPSQEVSKVQSNLDVSIPGYVTAKTSLAEASSTRQNEPLSVTSEQPSQSTKINLNQKVAVLEKASHSSDMSGEREKHMKKVMESAKLLRSVVTEMDEFIATPLNPIVSGATLSQMFARAEQLLDSTAHAAGRCELILNEAANVDCQNLWVGREISYAVEEELQEPLKHANDRWIQTWCWIMQMELMLPKLVVHADCKKRAVSHSTNSVEASFNSMKRYEKPLIFDDKVTLESVHAIELRRSMQLKSLKQIVREMMISGMSRCQLVILQDPLSNTRSALRWTQIALCDRATDENGVIKSLTAQTRANQVHLSLQNNSSDQEIPPTADVLVATFDVDDVPNNVISFVTDLREKLKLSKTARSQLGLIAPGLVVVQHVGQVSRRTNTLTAVALAILKNEGLVTNIEVITIGLEKGSTAELSKTIGSSLLQRFLKCPRRKHHTVVSMLKEAGTRAWMSVVVKARSYQDLGRKGHEVIAAVNDAWLEVSKKIRRESLRWPVEIYEPRSKLDDLSRSLVARLRLPFPEDVGAQTTTDYIKTLIAKFGEPKRQTSNIVGAEHELVRFCRWLDDLLPLVIRDSLKATALETVELSVERNDEVISHQFQETQKRFLSMDRVGLGETRRGTKRDGNNSEEEVDRHEKRPRRYSRIVGTEVSRGTFDALISESKAYRSVIADTLEAISAARRRTSA